MQVVHEGECDGTATEWVPASIQSVVSLRLRSCDMSHVQDYFSHVSYFFETLSKKALSGDVIG